MSKFQKFVIFRKYSKFIFGNFCRYYKKILIFVSVFRLNFRIFLFVYVLSDFAESFDVQKNLFNRVFFQRFLKVQGKCL